jgi:ABC-type Fe3+/spermidine/putrescine transport system ATPase subunit
MSVETKNIRNVVLLGHSGSGKTHVDRSDVVRIRSYQ